MGISNKKGDINTLILIIAALIIVAISLVVLTKEGEILIRAFQELLDNLSKMFEELLGEKLENYYRGIVNDV